MKVPKGILVFDFAIQAILGAFVFYSIVFTSIEPAREFFGSDLFSPAFGAYIILGIWQYLFSLFLAIRYKSNFRVPYLKRVGIFLGFIIICFITYSPISMFALVIMLFVPPVIAIVRFANTYMELNQPSA